jgi:hypothetical protein
MQFRKATPFGPLHIISTSKYIIDCFFKKFTNWEHNGWITIPNKELIRAIVTHLQAQGAITTFARATDPAGLKNANILAQDGSHKMLHDILDLTPVQKFNLTGDKLATISQATAYKGVQKRQCPHHECAMKVDDAESHT